MYNCLTNAIPFNQSIELKSAHYMRNQFSRYMVYMDENGDAEGNYTLIALDDRPTRGYGLYPIAYFVGKEAGTNLPVSKLFFSLQYVFTTTKMLTI